MIKKILTTLCLILIPSYVLADADVVGVISSIELAPGGIRVTAHYSENDGGDTIKLSIQAVDGMPQNVGTAVSVTSNDEEGTLIAYLIVGAHITSTEYDQVLNGYEDEMMMSVPAGVFEVYLDNQTSSYTINHNEFNPWPNYNVQWSNIVFQPIGWEHWKEYINVTVGYEGHLGVKGYFKNNDDEHEIVQNIGTFSDDFIVASSYSYSTSGYITSLVDDHDAEDHDEDVGFSWSVYNNDEDEYLYYGHFLYRHTWTDWPDFLEIKEVEAQEPGGDNDLVLVSLHYGYSSTTSFNKTITLRAWDHLTNDWSTFVKNIIGLSRIIDENNVSSTNGAYEGQHYINKLVSPHVSDFALYIPGNPFGGEWRYWPDGFYTILAQIAYSVDDTINVNKP